MNATEDGLEPAGESPAIDTLKAIGRGAVAGMLAGADYAKAITAIRELHSPSYAGGELGPFCDTCEESVGPYPCPTIRAIDSAGV